MRLSELSDFFTKRITARDLSVKIKGEVEQYKHSTSIKGGSTPVTLIENSDLHFSSNNLISICTAYLNKELTKWEIYYIVDALVLSNRIKFENEEVFSLLETLTDPAVNGEITEEAVNEVLSQL